LCVLLARTSVFYKKYFGNYSCYENTKRESFKKILVQSGIFGVQEAGFLVK